MSRIRSRDTKPEMIVRSLVHSMGYRYRLHRKDLPGTPDLVFTPRRKIIFVHGCFFHMHACRYGTVIPATNPGFWETKRQGNVRRDEANIAKLVDSGWSVLVVWECEIKKLESLQETLKKFLDS